MFIYGFNYRAWPFITSFIDHAIYVGQSAMENHWRVTVLEFLTLRITVSNDQYQKYKVLKQYLVLVTKEQWGNFFVQSDFVSA